MGRSLSLMQTVLSYHGVGDPVAGFPKTSKLDGSKCWGPGFLSFSTWSRSAAACSSTPGCFTATSPPHTYFSFGTGDLALGTQCLSQSLLSCVACERHICSQVQRNGDRSLGLVKGCGVEGPQRGTSLAGSDGHEKEPMTHLSLALEDQAPAGGVG